MLGEIPIGLDQALSEDGADRDEENMSLSLLKSIARKKRSQEAKTQPESFSLTSSASTSKASDFSIASQFYSKPKSSKSKTFDEDKNQATKEAELLKSKTLQVKSNEFVEDNPKEIHQNSAPKTADFLSSYSEKSDDEKGHILLDMMKSTEYQTVVKTFSQFFSQNK